MKPHKLTLEIDLTYAAFDDGPSIEVARILRKLADRLESGHYSLLDLDGDGVPMIDINGNTVGRARVAEEA